MGFDPPTAREAGSGVNGCRFLGIPHGYTPGGASHARKHRTSAASALAISAVGAGETESNHVYCRILFEIMLFLTIILFMHSAFRGRGPRRATYEVPISDLVTPPALVAAHAVAGVGDIDRAAGIAIAARSCLLASGTGPGVEIDSSRGRDPDEALVGDRTPLGLPSVSLYVWMVLVVHFPPCLSIRTRLCTQAAFK
jgi:hypothetical protein